MKLILIACLSALLATLSQAQTIKFPADSLPALLKIAEAEKKAIFILLNSDNSSTFPRVVKLESDKKAATFFNSNFINYRPECNTAEFNELVKKYFVIKFPAYLYLDEKGNLLNSSAGLALSGERYIEDAKAALDKKESGKTLSWYNESYANGNRSREFLGEYISERMKLGLIDNYKLIDDYAFQLTLGDFENFEMVAFLLNAGPVAYGRVHKQMSPKLTDCIFKTLPEQKRYEINNKIIHNTKLAAVEKKSLDIAKNGAGFAGSTWGGNFRRAEMAYQSNIIEYYREVKDTANFLKTLDLFIYNFYMNLSADSIKKLSPNLKNMEKKAMLLLTRNIPTDTADKGRLLLAGANAHPNTVPDELNNAAWDFYLYGKNNRNYLNKAAEWSKRSLDFYQKPEYYDTLAHLLYGLEDFAGAEITQMKAIKEAKKQQQESDKFRDELNKIKERRL